VAGIIAAVDDTSGVIGVAPKATIVAVKVLHGGSGSFGQVIEGILYAADPGGGGAHIINMSLGALFPRGGGKDNGAGPLVAAMARAVNYATDQNVLVVSSAGNSGVDLDHSGSYISIPAQSGSGIAVSATAPVGFAVGWPSGATNFSDPASYTNFGRSAIWVSAPGGDSALPGSAVCAIPRVVGAPIVNFCWVFDLILSPGSNSGSSFFAAGTSMAAPHVAGVAALIVQRFPGISVGDLKTKLAQTADGPSDPYSGHGFINAYRAVTE
jgi:subtilisin family serine protease